jgi:flagellar FliL protein
MADEKEREETEATSASSGKGGKLKLVLILVGVLLLLGGGGVGAYFMLSGGGKQDAEAKAEKADAPPATILNLELAPFLVNLSDPGGGHYLKTTLTLELQNENASQWINARLPRVRDRVLLLLSSKESSELLSAEGKFRLRDDVLRAINEMMGEDKVSAVYLTEFVVQ